MQKLLTGTDDMRRVVVGFFTLSLLAAAVMAWQSESTQTMKLEIDRERSHLVAITGKAGFLGFLGHKHAILATEWQAEITFAPRNISASWTEITIPVKSLRIDSKQALEKGRLDSAPSEEDVKQIQQKMLGPKVLDAEKYPQIRFVSTSVARKDENTIVVKGRLSLHGRPHEISVPVKVNRQPDGAMRFSSEFEIKQTNYGMEPESIAGVVKVANEVKIRFQVVGKPSSGIPQ